MNSTRTRILIALLMMAGSFSVALAAESATAAPTFSLNLTVSDLRPEVGEAVRVSGKVTPAAPGKRVKVQGKAAGTGWVTIARPRLNNNSVYRASLRFPREGGVAIRVVKPASRTVAQGVSRERRLRVGAALTAPVITTTTLPSAAVGSAYSETVETADGRPGAFTIAAGALPAGLSLHDQTGVISGTPTAEGTSSFTVSFRDPDGLSDSQPLSITVGPPATAPVISTTTLPNGTVGTAYSQTLKTVGNKTGTWSISAGTLPPGLTGNSSTGVISGTPTTAGTTTFTAKFTETATGLSDTQDLSITIEPATPPVITTTSLPAGTATRPYSATLQTAGNRAGTWSRTSGSLPAGLTLNGATGVISGTPTTPGTSSFTVVFTATNGLTDTQALSILVDPSTPPQIVSSPLPQGVVGTAYSATLQTVGNRAGTWSRTSGSLPEGLTLNGATGVISGTPIAPGTDNFTVLFTAAGGLTDSDGKSITVVAAP
ncbi:MAG: Ig domain-containing protein [Actinomycetota bacterium]|nr:Ig domain-containing protein [Actinomycetota bacterium]